MNSKKYMSIEEIQRSFDKLSADPNPRSLQAMLRIGTEQLKERGRLGFWRNMVFVTGALSLVAVFTIPFVPVKFKDALTNWKYVFVGVCVVSVIFLFRVRSVLEQYLAEEQTVKHMLIETAQKIVSAPNYNPSPLSDDLKSTLRDAMRHEKNTDKLQNLIDVH
jgi:Na+/melibiose symporter-like transporter